MNEENVALPDVCPSETQSFPVPGSEIGSAQDPDGLPLYPGTIQTEYSKPPEWDAPTYAWYVIPASAEEAFQFFINESLEMGYVVFPKESENQLHITANNKYTFTIDLYPENRWAGYETGMQVFWYVDE